LKKRETASCLRRKHSASFNQANTAVGYRSTPIARAESSPYAALMVAMKLQHFGVVGGFSPKSGMAGVPEC
jgi:hypothetical protein